MSFDGIELGDRDVPRGWLVAFWLAALFAAGYWMYFHSLGAGQSSLERYSDDKLALLDVGGEATEEELAKLVTDPLMIEGGKKAFARYCVECHLAQGQGKTGPNLTDSYWLYGDGLVDMYQTVFGGKTGKGMPAWGPSLGSGKVKQLVVFLRSIRNTNVPGKEPEGVLRP